MKSKYRLKFTKLDKMIYIGHLDLLKLIQRAINRAKLPIAYSNGFNPHQTISFAMPLSVGSRSIGEYVDIVLEETLEPKEVQDRLNEVLPKGMEIIKVKQFPEFHKNSATTIAYADYKVLYETSFDVNNTIDKLMKSDEIIVTKKGKKGTMKDIDIKPLIVDIYEITDDSFKCKLKAGSTENLKVDLLASAVLNSANVSCDFIRYERLEMYEVINNQITPLIEI